MFSMYQAAASGAIAFSALTLLSPAPVSADCTPLWSEEVGLASQFVPRVSDMLVFDDGTGDALYAAGLLDVGGLGDDTTGAVRFDGETWVSLEAPPGDFASAKLLAEYNGELYGAGGFRIFNSVSQQDEFYRVARWDAGTSQWVPVSGVVPQFFTVFTGDAMVAFDGALYIGGRHTAGDGVGAAYFSRYDGSTWGPVPNLPAQLTFSNVQDLYVFNGSLYASYGSLFANGSVYRLDEDGGTWEQVGGDVPSFNRMASFNNELYVAGSNSQFQTPVANNVLRYNELTEQWEAIDSSTSYAFTFIHAAVSADDGTGEALFIGGEILDIEGVPVSHVAKWDGTSWSSLGGGVLDDFEMSDDASVMALAAFDGALWAGGEFENVDNNGDVIASPGVGRWGCDAPPVDAFESTLVVGASAISSFGGTTTITVTPRTADGDLLDAGQDVVIDIDAGTLLGTVVDLGNGTYTQDLQGDLSAGTQVRATVNGVELLDMPYVNFVPVDRSLSSIDLSIDQTFLGSGGAVITVTLADDLGNSVGSGFDVIITTTLGTLVGSVVDHGDGTYSQAIIPDQTGTASINATVDGMALNTSAALTVLDPMNIGSIIGYDGNGNPVPFMSIQAAIDAAAPGGTVFIASGTYNETILLNGASGLMIEGLSALQPVVIRGVVVSESSDVSLRYLTIDTGGANLPKHAVEVRGGSRASNGVEILGSTITNAKKTGVLVDRNNQNVHIIDSTIVDNGDDGVSIDRDGGGYIIANSTISNNGKTGLKIDRGNSNVQIIDSAIEFNGKDGVDIGRDADGRSIVNSTISGNGGSGVKIDRGNNTVHIVDSVIENNGDDGVNIGRDGNDRLIANSTISGNGASGLEIDRGNHNTQIVGCIIENNQRYGANIGRDAFGNVISGNSFSYNGWIGLAVDRGVAVTIENNDIVGNGSAFSSPNNKGYGLFRSRHGSSGNPQQITLINNTLANNNGRVQNNRSDSNVGNYDQIIDSTDDQSPYTD